MSTSSHPAPTPSDPVQPDQAPERTDETPGAVEAAPTAPEGDAQVRDAQFPDDEAPQVGPPTKRGRQTALDMVLSMAAILAVVGVVLLFAPQPGPVEQPQVADADAVLAVDEATQVLGVPPLLLRPGAGSEVPSVVELGEDWRLDYARTEETDDIPTWRVGVLSPDERRVDLEQAVEPTEDWLTRSDDGEAGLPEPVEVQGLTWTRQVRGDGRTAYSYVDTATGLTTALSASSDSDDLQRVVGLVSGSLSG